MDDIYFPPRELAVMSVLWRLGSASVAEVRDTGVGIAPEHQRRIYEPFWQVEQGRLHASIGTGLGLNVVRNLMQLLGGGIHAESRAGEGSRFTLWVPRSRAYHRSGKRSPR